MKNETNVITVENQYGLCTMEYGDINEGDPYIRKSGKDDNQTVEVLIKTNKGVKDEVLIKTDDWGEAFDRIMIFNMESNK